MVHSGANAPLMPTTPSASPHLTVSAQGAPLQAQPPRSTPTDDEGQAKPSADLVKETPRRHPESGPGSPLSPDHFQAAVNGRSSGRKRTPKACDCCGPNGKGHDDKTTPSRGGRGRGRPRGRGRGRPRGSGRGWGRGRGHGSYNGEAPKRQTHGHETFEPVDDDEDDDEEDSEEYDVEERATGEVVIGTDGQSDTSFDLPSDVAWRAGPMKTYASKDFQKEEAALELPKDFVAEADGQALPVVGASSGPEVTQQVAEEMEQGESPAVNLHPAGSTNGNSVHFSEDAKSTESQASAEGVVLPGGGISDGDELVKGADDAAVSGEESASQPVGPGKQDSVMQVDPPAHVNDPVSNAMPAGETEDVALVVEMDSSCALTDETPAFHTARSPAPSLPPPEPISVQSSPQRWALRDHRQYCLLGTWVPEAGGGELLVGEGALQAGQPSTEADCTEMLTEMLHEFLESSFLKYRSFIPLSETDVLEHLKKKTNMDLSKRKLDIPGEMRRFKAGLASAPVAGFMVTYNKHTLSLDDLGTLEEQNWLNDQVINMYGELIMEATQRKVHFFNSFFHKQLVAKGYEGVKRWTKKVDLFSKWLLLVPIHLEIHWSLITVNTATKTISYYDSQGVVFKHTIDGIPQQKNDSDCGVFVLEYCRRLSRKEPLSFSQDDMPHIRKRIYKELCDRRLND
ncbi:hypothetical protein CRUP_037135 [Coryphaenoides rupestris]|nr:hypothetical protein CRUP_037135 [Coryphaenoides rupestris]